MWTIIKYCKLSRNISLICVKGNLSGSRYWKWEKCVHDCDKIVHQAIARWLNGFSIDGSRQILADITRQTKILVEHFLRTRNKSGQVLSVKQLITSELRNGRVRHYYRQLTILKRVDDHFIQWWKTTDEFLFVFVAVLHPFVQTRGRSVNKRPP